jgi:adenosine deaminase
VSEFLRRLPKAELHLHVEGTLEPELLFELAHRNGVELAWRSIEEVRAAYVFADLQSFLDVYYAACDVLLTERDFHQLTAAYVERAVADGVCHAEIFFDPQSHTARGVPMADVVGGIHRALVEAEARHGMTSRLILCFLRHLSAEDAMATLDEALPHLDVLDGVGLDSAEVGNPPSRFAEVFARARQLGLFAVAHAGEEGPPDYVTEALDHLGARRIDHGVRAIEDDALVDRLVRERVPLTVCPLSNVRLGVFPTMAEHTLPALLERGVVVTVNSDDPAYFGGYVADNYAAVAALGLTRAQLVLLARNSFEASQLDAATRARHLARLEAFVASA